MLFKTGLNVASKRAFSKTAIRASGAEIYGVPKAGPYSNLPFKVKDRVIPFAIPYWGTIIFFFGFPFMSSYWQMKKAGSFEDSA